MIRQQTRDNVVRVGQGIKRLAPPAVATPAATVAPAARIDYRLATPAQVATYRQRLIALGHIQPLTAAAS